LGLLGGTPVAVLTMSEVELARAEILRDLDEDRLTVEAVERLLGLSRRQVFRVLKAYRSDGAQGLISCKRGRPSDRKISPATRDRALQIVREKYVDFGPIFAAEKLAELHQLPVSKETLRRWMVEDGIWLDHRRRLQRAYQPRYRRDCVGELVQVDGREHWWFEDRGRQCSLLVFIDDATSQLMQLRFVRTESTFAYFDAVRAYLETLGKPVAFYTDKHVVFRVNKRDARRGDGMTQFGRALHGLNIDLICANSSQAKGRVERAHKTLQDRLVKELRLAGVNDIDRANAFVLVPHHRSSFTRARQADRTPCSLVARHDFGVELPHGFGDLPVI
jgi:transposase